MTVVCPENCPLWAEYRVLGLYVQVTRTGSSFRLLQENKNTLSVMNKEIRALLEESAECFRSLQSASRNLYFDISNRLQCAYRCLVSYNI
jgi:hypothetical protein